MEPTDQEAYWRAAGEVWVAQNAALDAMFVPMSEAILEAADIAAGQAVLDVGCGMGTLARAAAARVGPAGRVVGIDISAPLIEAARPVPTGTGAADVAYVLGDAQVLAMEGGAFDRAISRMGLMFFADPVAAFANIGRAMRPGGRLVGIAWRRGADSPWFDAPGAVARRLGAEPPSDPHAPGPMAFADPDRVTGILRAAGWQAEVRQTDLILTPSGDLAAVTDLSLHVGPVGAFLAASGADADTRARARDALTEALAPFGTAEGIRFPTRMNLILDTWPT